MIKFISVFSRSNSLKILARYCPKQCCGSGRRGFFDPWIRDGKNPDLDLRSGMNIPDNFSESLETVCRAENTLLL
jgi:hypothetical protein